jgi:hypothetical protein
MDAYEPRKCVKHPVFRIVMNGVCDALGFLAAGARVRLGGRIERVGGCDWQQSDRRGDRDYKRRSEY